MRGTLVAEALIEILLKIKPCFSIDDGPWVYFFEIS